MRRDFIALAGVLLVALISATPAASAAGLLQDGDIVVPGEGCLWKLGGTNPTAWMTSNAFGWGHDAMEDSKGRIVFIAGAGNNVNSVALFRADPATGSLERLLMLPYIVFSGDTLPDQVGATGFYGATQSLHTERVYSISVNDTVNGGVPQVGTKESYVFSIGAAITGVLQGVAIRWLPDENRAEKAFDVSGCQTAYGVAMASDGGTVYYGGNDMVFSVGPQLDLGAHFTVAGVGSVDARLKITMSNLLLYDSQTILDDRNIPNVTGTCGNISDDNVPMVGGGFAVFTDALGLGLLGGSLYATTNSGASTTPYEFNLAPRGTFLNPNICQYYKAVLFTGGTPWVLGDTLATTPTRGDSPDGSSVLANASGNILSVSPGGAVPLARNDAFRGRPLRWHTPASALASPGTAAAAAVDPSLTTLMVRVDSLVRVLLTDPHGHRIGVTAGDTVVNDFGPAGAVTALGASGWPKLITLVNPAPGNQQVEVSGDVAGDYGVTAYLAESSTGGVKRPMAGTIAAGETQHRVLQLLPPLTLGWLPPNTGVGETRGRAALGFDRVGPLPAAGAVRFDCSFPTAGAARLEIFDLSGRRVATVFEGMRQAGPFSATWTGRGGDGQRLAAGVYLARLGGPKASMTHRIVLLQ